MQSFRSTLFVLIPLGVVGPAFGQEKLPETAKVFTYKKTKQADLALHVHFPPDWKQVG
jgi:hypothetical protein